MNRKQTLFLGSLVFLMAGASCATRGNPPPPPAYPAPAGPPGEAPLERWAERHPEAARELGDWAHTHPEAARRFFEWDGHHPERAHELVEWTLAHPGEGPEAFARSHPGWPFANEVMLRHRPASEGFMAWCRRHPPAARSLMSHPRGLQWAGHNLYRL